MSSRLFAIALGLGLAFLLHGCGAQDQPPRLITSVQAAELPDGSPAGCRPFRERLTGEASFEFGMDAPVPMLAAQEYQESSCRTDAHSLYAAGLAQFAPATAEWISKEYGLGPAQPLDAEWSIRAQVRYMKYLRDRALPRYAGNDCQSSGAALGAYNGGEGHVIDRERAAINPRDYFGSVRNVTPPRVSAASQAENAGYAQRIVATLQPKFRLWGTVTCPEMLT